MYELVNIMSGSENLPDELKLNKSILYRFYNKSNNKNYIGTASHGMKDRLYDPDYGHITLIGVSHKCNNMYFDMKNDPQNFQLFIERYEDATPEVYSQILDLETEFIIKYDSVLNGYNVSMDGKPGWKEGSICVHKGKFNYYIRPKDLVRFLTEGEFKLGRWDGGDNYHLKGRIFMNNGKDEKMVPPDKINEFLNMNYVIGRFRSPNKGKVWRNNGVKSKLLKPEDLIKDEFKDFIYEGRLEPKRKPRGPYNSKGRKKVNNGIIEISIPLDELDEFLKINPEYSLGRLCKGYLIVSNDELQITKHINKSEYDEYKSKGFRYGRLKKKT